MEKVLAELRSSADRMAFLNCAIEKKDAELKSLILMEKSKIVNLDKKIEILKEKEGKYSEYDNLESMKINIDSDRKALKTERDFISKELARIDTVSKELESKLVEVAKMKDLFVHKNKRCDEYSAKLEVDRKEMKEKILNDIKIGLK